MINVDISNVWGELSLNDLLGLEKEVFAAHKTLIERKGAGSEYLGWLDLPTFEATDEMRRIVAAAKRIREERTGGCVGFAQGRRGAGVAGDRPTGARMSVV